MKSLMTCAWVDIALSALLRNGAKISGYAGIPLLTVIKAAAYGLGAIRIARALEMLDPWGFGVATTAEGEELRRAGIARPIVIFTPLLADELDAARRARLTPALSERASIRRWAPTGLPWYLAVDTGMSRAGADGTKSLHYAMSSRCPPRRRVHALSLRGTGRRIAAPSGETLRSSHRGAAAPLRNRACGEQSRGRAKGRRLPLALDPSAPGHLSLRRWAA